MSDQARAALPHVLACRFGATFPELHRVVGELLSFLSRRGVAEDTVNHVNLVVEEMATNIIKYGYDDALPHTVDLRVEVGRETVVLVLEDDGHEFDPLAAPAPDTNKPLAERRPGGLGIALVRHFAASMGYERRGGRNRLTVAVARG